MSDGPSGFYGDAPAGTGSGSTDDDDSGSSGGSSRDDDDDSYDADRSPDTPSGGWDSGDDSGSDSDSTSGSSGSDSGGNEGPSGYYGDAPAADENQQSTDSDAAGGSASSSSGSSGGSTSDTETSNPGPSGAYGDAPAAGPDGRSTDSDPVNGRSGSSGSQRRAPDPMDRDSGRTERGQTDAEVAESQQTQTQGPSGYYGDAAAGQGTDGMERGPQGAYGDAEAGGRGDGPTSSTPGPDGAYGDVDAGQATDGMERGPAGAYGDADAGEPPEQSTPGPSGFYGDADAGQGDDGMREGPPGAYGDAAPGRSGDGYPGARGYYGDADAGQQGDGLEGPPGAYGDAPAQADSGLSTDAPVDTDRLTQARRDYAAQVSEQTGQDYSAEDVDVERTEDGQLRFSVDRRESFDIDWSFGFGGPEDEVESTIDDIASGYSTRANELGETLFATDTETENSAGANILRSVGRPDLASQYDQSVRNLGAGVVSGGLQIANVPGLVGSGMELAEVGVAGASETASGSGGEFGSDVVDRGSAIGEAVVEQADANRAQTGGMLLGSLGVTAGVFSAASRIGSRTGTATRLAIQPGEEIVGRAGFRATRATAGEQRAQQLFPNREPLFLSEEAAIRGGRAASDAARRAGSSTASRVARESTALRFRVEEAVRSDAPSRGTSDNFVSQAGQRARREAVSARFRAAETAENVREGTRSRARSARDTLNEFAGDERGQMQPPRSELRGETDARQLEQPGRRLEQETAGDDLAGQRGGQIERSRLREPTVDRDSARSAELEPDARSTSRPGTRLRVEPAVGSTTDSPVSRMRSAQEASVETSPLRLGGTESRLSSEVVAETETRTDARGRTDLESELRTGFEGRADTRTDLRSRQETRSELAMETETRRRETEPLDMTGDAGDGESFLGGFLGEGDTTDRDLINPFTGE